MNQQRRLRRKQRTEGKLLRAGSLHGPGRDTGCANCGESVVGGAFFGATVTQLYLEDDVAPEVKAAAQKSNGAPVVFGVCKQCLLGDGASLT